jgi:hypothetical protein
MIKRRFFSLFSKTKIFNVNYYSDEQLKEDYLRQKSIEHIWNSNLIEKHKYLRLPKVEPNYLLIIDDNLANKLSDSIINNISKQTHTFIELNPGFGLITKNIINLNRKHNLIKNYYLFESSKKYLNYSKEIQEQQQQENKNVHLFKDSNPFSLDRFKFPAEVHDDLKKGSLAIFGILPWNHKIFLQSMYSHYSNDVFLFNNDYSLELFLILPEFIAAQLQPELESNNDNNKKFISINTKLSIQSAIFSDIKILSIESAHNFYPYPLASPRIKTKFKDLSIDYTKMYLTHIKFLPCNKLLVNDKQLFNRFLTQLWANSNNLMKNSLQNLYFDLKPLQNHKFNLNRRINTFHAYEFLEIYNILNENPLNSTLKNKTYLRK